MHNPSGSGMMRTHLVYKSLFMHSGYAIGGAAIGSLLSALGHPHNVVQFISFAAAYAALCFLSWALLIGPLRVLRGGRPLVSNRQRRHVGIWAGIFTMLHVAAGLNVHFGGHFNQYFFTPADGLDRMSFRYDAFGFTNDLGVLATVGTAILLGLSNDVSLRKIGAQRWKFLQRISYPVFTIVVVHSGIYQLLEHRSANLMILVASMFSLVATLQARGFLTRRRTIAISRSPITKC